MMYILLSAFLAFKGLTRNVEIPQKPGFPTAAAIKKNGPGEIIRKMHETLSIDLLYNPKKYH